MLLAINQEWIILDVDWYPIIIKGVLVGITILGFICVVISAVSTIENKLTEVQDIEPCETVEDVIKREG
jgi:F420-0:gamma-glutamyl ligase